MSIRDTAAFTKVVSGIGFLSEKVPEWQNKIDRRWLDIADCLHCVLAQVTGKPYEDALDLLSLSYLEAERFGFSAQDTVTLQAAWDAALDELGVR